MNVDDYKALKATAATEGLYTGLAWVASFACFIGQFANPSLSMASMLIALLSVIFVIIRLRRYRDTKLDELPFFKAFVYSLSVFLYASLVMALGQWIYFQFLDQGYMIQEYMKQLQKPEIMEVLKGIEGFKEDDLQFVLDQFNSLRPIDIAFQFLSTNIILGLLLSFPVAALSMGKSVKK